MIQDSQNYAKEHYVCIKNLSRLVSTQISSRMKKHFICDNCLNYFYSQEKLNKHYFYCHEKNDCNISFSHEKYITFKNFQYKEKLPFVIYCDFESMLLPFEEEKNCCNISISKT